MHADSVWNIVTNPAWRPFTDVDLPGYVVLIAIAAVLVGLTLWTYLGAAQTTSRRLFTLIFLRLLALVVAIITMLRPALAITDQPRIPSTLIIVADVSESMSVKDEYSGLSRWQVVQQVLKRSEGVLDELKNDQQVTVYLYRFAKDFDPAKDVFNPDDKAEGKRTDFGTMLGRLYDQHQGEKKLRGLIILSDGVDNGTARPTLAEAAKWRGIGCPIYCFAVGQSSTPSEQKDIAFTTIAADPSPVPVKADLTVRATLNAQGFQGATVKVRLLLDDKPVKVDSFQLLKTIGNEVEMTIKAPEKPGEVKVTLEVGIGDLVKATDPLRPLPGEVTDQNNKIETYLTVTREGVRVLYIDRLRPESKVIRAALATDRRFDFIEYNRQTEGPVPEAVARQFDLGAESYDVIILGGITATQLSTLRPGIMDKISELVREKGLGLMMIGGEHSFGGTLGSPGSGDWVGTPIAQILPVDFIKVKQENVPVEMVPDPEALSHYILRLDGDPKKNAKIWDRLNGSLNTRLSGFTPFSEKPNATILARAVYVGEPKGKPLLVGQNIGKGRTLAFGGDTTINWWLLGLDNATNPKEGMALTARFWKQAVLWLAHQDEVEGNVYVRPEFRRLAVNGKQIIHMGVRNKHNDEIPNADLRYQVLAPGEKEDEKKALRPERDGKGNSRATYEPKQPGEYIVRVWGKGKDPEGAEIADQATARFIVYPEISDEMLFPAAKPEFLLNLENTTNGTNVDLPRRADQLPSFLEELKSNPLKPALVKPKLYPDWRRNANKWFLPTVLLLFVGIIGLEWGLRRLWGMV